MQSGSLKKSNEYLLTIVFSIVLAMTVLFKSPLNPLLKVTVMNQDSAVFRTVAYAMSRGYMPYRDSFDHKGPIIYILNFIGDYVISEKYGLWLIEVLSMAISVFFLYLTARLISDRLKSCFVVLLSTSLILLYFHTGNFVEEYALPYIAISNYIFLDYMIKSEITLKRVLICGMCFGFVIMLRPNMITVWLYFCIVILFGLLRQRQIALALKYAGLFVAGAAAAVVPIIIWFIGNNGLSDFWDDYIMFNLLYSSSGIDKKMEAFCYFGSSPLILISLLISAVYAIVKKDKTASVCLGFEMLSLIMVSIGGTKFDHYGLTLVPCIVYPLCLLMRIPQWIRRDRIRLWVENVMALFMSFAFILPAWIAVGLDIYDANNNVDNPISMTTESAAIAEVVEVIRQETSYEDKISVFGSWDNIYISADRMHATQYSYQDPICYADPDMMRDYIDQLESEKPVLIVVQSGYYNQINSALLENNYELIWVSDPDNVSSSTAVFKLV